MVHVRNDRTTTAAQPSRCASAASPLREVILLAGKVRPTPLSSAIERSLVDLPASASHSLMDAWQQQLDALAEHLDIDPLPVRVMIDHASQAPRVSTPGRAHITVERDPNQFRGTGGVIRDVTRDFDPADRVLVAQAAQLLIEPLPALFDRLVETGGDVTVVAQTDGLPSGTLLIRCGALASVADVGFVDLKEQALPRIAEEFNVQVARLERPGSYPIRTLADYIHALRVAALDRAGGNGLRHDPFEESWRTSFAIMENGASVSPRARIHDSVILRGGEVGPDAVVVNCVVGPGGRVAARRQIVGEVVGRGRQRQESLDSAVHGATRQP